MAKRWFLCPVIGTGAEGDYYRAKVADYGVAHVAVIPSKPDGSPLLNWCIVKVAASDFTQLDADADVDGWPNVSLDTTVSQLPAPVRTRIRAALTKRGIDTSDVTGATPLRAILKRIGRAMEATFDPDVVDVTG
jgi:hypothetical protein